MRLNPHLIFDGQCVEAFQFYQRCLGGTVATMLTWGDSPIANLAPECGSDALPGQYEQPKGFSVMLVIDDPADTDRIFQSVAEGVTVTMPIQKTFWALRFGALIDAFGIPWEINCEQPPATS